MKKGKGKRHYTRQELLYQLNSVARERRICERSPWTAMNIICGYALMKTFDFKGVRISNISNRIAEMQEKIDSGELSIKELSDKLMDKVGWTVEWEPYTEESIPFRKGTYDYWIEQKQLYPKSKINELASNHLIMFFTALNEMHGFGGERMQRVLNKIYEMLDLYANNKAEIKQWRLELLNDAGVHFEDPADTIGNSYGSIMTGGV